MRPYVALCVQCAGGDPAHKSAAWQMACICPDTQWLPDSRPGQERGLPQAGHKSRGSGKSWPARIPEPEPQTHVSYAMLVTTTGGTLWMHAPWMRRPEAWNPRVASPCAPVGLLVAMRMAVLMSMGVVMPMAMVMLMGMGVLVVRIRLLDRLGGSHSAPVLALDVEGGVNAARLGAEDGVDVHPAVLAGLHLHRLQPSFVE